MAPALDALGRRIEDVRWILLTHGHIDHVGGAHALWELTGRRAEIVIHEADAPMLRSRRAHVEEYLAVRGRYLHDPEGEAKQIAMAAGAISGEMEPTRAGPRRRDAVARAATSPSPCTPCRAHRGVGRLRRRRPARRLRRRRGADARCGQRVPRLRDPDAYRASLEHLRDDVRPRHLFLGHPYRHADGVPYGVELDREQAHEALQGSLDIEAGVGRAPLPGTASERPASRTRPSPASPRNSATPATRPSSHLPSSPPCTVTPGSCTTMGDVRPVDAGGRPIGVRKDLRVPMRDGVTLAADVYSRHPRTSRGRRWSR